MTLLTNTKTYRPLGSLGTLSPGGPCLLSDCDLYSAPGWSSDPLRAKQATQSLDLLSGRAQNVVTEGTSPDSPPWWMLQLSSYWASRIKRLLATFFSSLGRGWKQLWLPGSADRRVRGQAAGAGRWSEQWAHISLKSWRNFHAAAVPHKTSAVPQPYQKQLACARRTTSRPRKQGERILLYAEEFGLLSPHPRDQTAFCSTRSHRFGVSAAVPEAVWPLWGWPPEPGAATIRVPAPTPPPVLYCPSRAASPRVTIPGLSNYQFSWFSTTFWLYISDF